MWGPEPNAELLRLRAAEQEGRPHSIWLGRCPPGMEGSLLGAQAPVYRVSTQTVLCGPSPGAAAEGGRLGADWSPARALRAVWLWEELRGQPPGPLSHTPTDATLPGWSTPPRPKLHQPGGMAQGSPPTPCPPTWPSSCRAEEPATRHTCRARAAAPHPWLARAPKWHRPPGSLSSSAPPLHGDTRAPPAETREPRHPNSRGPYPAEPVLSGTGAGWGRGLSSRPGQALGQSEGVFLTAAPAPPFPCRAPRSQATSWPLGKP